MPREELFLDMHLKRRNKTFTILLVLRCLFKEPHSLTLSYKIKRFLKILFRSTLVLDSKVLECTQGLKIIQENAGKGVLDKDRKIVGASDFRQ